MNEAEVDRLSRSLQTFIHFKMMHSRNLQTHSTASHKLDFLETAMKVVLSSLDHVSGTLNVSAGSLNASRELAGATASTRSSRGDTINEFDQNAADVLSSPDRVSGTLNLDAGSLIQ